MVDAIFIQSSQSLIKENKRINVQSIHNEATTPGRLFVVSSNDSTTDSLFSLFYPKVNLLDNNGSKWNLQFSEWDGLKDTSSIDLSFLNFVNDSANKFGFQKADFETQSIAFKINSFLKGRGIDFSSINPLPEGGISFEFYVAKVYYNIEVDNERDSVFYKEIQNGPPEAWDLTYDQLLEKLTIEFL